MEFELKHKKFLHAVNTHISKNSKKMIGKGIANKNYTIIFLEMKISNYYVFSIENSFIREYFLINSETKMISTSSKYFNKKISEISDFMIEKFIEYEL